MSWTQSQELAALHEANRFATHLRQRYRHVETAMAAVVQRAREVEAYDWVAVRNDLEHRAAVDRLIVAVRELKRQETLAKAAPPLPGGTEGETP